MTASSRTRRGSLSVLLVLGILASLIIPSASAAAPSVVFDRAPLANDLRISQVYGGGGNSGATYTHDFIEVFNAGSSTLSLAGYSVQYASTAGTTWQVTNLSGSLGPGQYYLIQEAQGAGGTTPLPTPDAIGNIPMAAANGKVALVNTTTPLTGACPTGAQIIDFVGFGTANCFEGTGATPPPSNTTAVLRANGGCTDTDDNAADFSAGAPTPRNTSSPTNSCSGDVPPTVLSTIPSNNATGVAVDAPVSVTFSEPVTVSGAIAISCTSSGVQNVTPTGGPTTFTLPHSDFAIGETCTVTILASQVTDQDGTPDNMAADYTWSFETTSGCTGPVTPIYTIQGSGASSPLVGQAHTVEGVVIANFQTDSSINGYFIQTPDGADDGNPATSEGLFIFNNGFGPTVAVGNLIRASGFVSEFQDQTQLSSINQVTICDPGPVAVTATPVTLPFPALGYRERFEGMSVVMTQTLTVNETYNLGRGGLLTLANGRLRQPTNVVLPGAPASALQAANDLNQITLDDRTRAQNVDPIIYPTPLGLSALNTVRSGDSVSGVTGVFTQGNPGWTTPGNIYRIYPSATAMPTFTATNTRPLAPDPVRAGGSLRVSSFNVLNYFLTLDTTNTPPFPCGPNQNQECRGANTAQEFTRQRDKLLQALNILNADVIGLMELENTPSVEPLADIVNGLNALAGPGAYDYINAGLINPGDVIKVGIIYKPGVVQPVGNFAILNHLVDPGFTNINRPALAQTFQEVMGNGRFTIVVNHLKSKGCTGATGLDADQGDGQACFNYTRTQAVNALLNWVASDPTGMGDPDFLIVGDLNSYAREDPITTLEGAGYTNLEISFEGPNGYSYVFSSQAGSLDHSMASATLFPQVTGATTWHINADEPTVLDYNTEFKSPGQIVSLYNADAYRTSDHDPLLIGLNLTPIQASMTLTKTVGTTPGVCAATSSITVPAGTVVYYCYTVANTGNLTLHRHDLADSELGSIFASLPYTLTPGSSIDTVTLGQMASTTINTTTVNSALWTGYNLGPIDVVTATATATVTVLPPNIYVDPLAISNTQGPNLQTQHTLTISNTGGSDLTWQIFEEPTRPAAPANQPLASHYWLPNVADELAGVEGAAASTLAPPDPAARARAKRALLTTGLLLVPDSTNDRVMALDPITGNVIDADFIPSNAVMGTAINAILSASGDSILVSDQTGDVVHEFDLDGNYLGIFAPAGGVNNAILDNIRGISLGRNNHLLVTVGSGANSNAIAEFDTNGNYLGNFVANGAGGLNSPFDIYGRTADWLSGGSSSSAVHRYDLNGAYIANFAPVSTFPEQIGEAGNSNVLVANFSPSSNEGVHEFTAAGVFVGRYDPAGLTGYRGVYELPGGTILTTTGAGVHEINRSGQLVQNKITGVGARFIEYVAPPSICTNLTDIPWLTTSPITGTTASGLGTDVTVTLDSTGLADGVYTGNLCITSNDPDAGPGNETELVIVPITLTVQSPTAVRLGDVAVTPAQVALPVAAGLPWGVIPAAVGLLAAAAYVMRRRR